MDEDTGKLPAPDSRPPTEPAESPEPPETADVEPAPEDTPEETSGLVEPPPPAGPEMISLDAIGLVDGDDEGPARRPVAPAHSEATIREIRDLKTKLDRKDKQIEQVMDAYRKQKKESEKLRDRIEKTERRRFEQSKGDFIARFVEVLDNLDRAIDSIENNFDADSVLQGIILVRSRLVQLLKTEGLEKIFVGGQPFDPTYSEAAGMEPVEEASQDNMVIKELQRGYMLKGSLLRAARVVVGKFEGTPEGPSEEAPPQIEPPEIPPGPEVPVVPEASPVAPEPPLQPPQPAQEMPAAPAPSKPQPRPPDPGFGDLSDELDTELQFGEETESGG